MHVTHEERKYKQHNGTQITTKTLSKSECMIPMNLVYFVLGEFVTNWIKINTIRLGMCRKSSDWIFLKDIGI